MLTTDIIITGVLFLLAVICFLGALIAGEGFETLAMFFLGALCGIIHFGLIDAEKRGNREFVTYSFPAEAFKMETVVNDRTTKVFVDGVETETTQKDTVYVLKGIEPIFENKKDRAEMRLKTVVREKL